MSLEAWGDENPAFNGPMKRCGNCDGSGEVQVIRDSLLVCSECPHCNGSGEVEDTDPEIFEDDYL